MTITFMSDSHGNHEQLRTYLPGADLLIHSGDFTNVGAIYDVIRFCDWYNGRTKYRKKILIAGNHDKSFENEPDRVSEVLKEFEEIIYLQDSSIIIDGIKIYGSPWQPEFYNWAFNLPRGGVELQSKWDLIEHDIDILITHSPPQSILDTSGSPHNEPLLGCELLFKKVKEIKPKIHIFGHIHGGYGYVFDGHTHFINASVLNEQYVFTNKPLTIDWNPITNEIEFL